MSFSFTGQLAGAGSYLGNISLAFGPPVVDPDFVENSGEFTMMHSPYPPLPGSPWWAITHGLGEAEQFQIADPNSPPNPPDPPRNVGNLLTLLARDPAIPPRLRRFTDQVTEILNSLIRQGVVIQTSPSEWALSLGLTDEAINALFAAVAGPHDFYAGPGPNFRTIEIEDLPLSGVSAGTYSYPTMSVNQFGLVTAIVSNPTPSSGGGSSPPIVSTTTNFALVNGYITASVAGNALTIAVKNYSGTDPDSEGPVVCHFRDATASAGSLETLSITAATSLTITSGSTLGVAASIPFRLWVVGFNDGGTFQLGVILATLNSGALSTAPLRDYMIASSTAEGGAGGADSAQVIYTSSAVTSKAMRVLGWLEWETAIGTPGTWGSAPIKIHQHMQGDPLPGEIVQKFRTTTAAVTTGTTLVPFDDTIPQSGEGIQLFTQAITPTSKANIIEAEADVFMFLSVAGAGVLSLYQDSTANAWSSTMVGQSTGSGPWRQQIDDRMVAGTISSTTIKLRGGGNNANTTTFNGISGARYYGGVQDSWLEVREVMS